MWFFYALSLDFSKFWKKKYMYEWQEREIVSAQ